MSSGWCDVGNRAVLGGLAGLGYEVSEGMATAWVKDGRVVLQKAASPGYRIELSGGSRAEGWEQLPTD
jgi:hypothetical protein